MSGYARLLLPLPGIPETPREKYQILSTQSRRRRRTNEQTAGRIEPVWRVSRTSSTPMLIALTGMLAR